MTTRCDMCVGKAQHSYYSETDARGVYWHVLCRKCSVAITNEIERG